MSGAAARNPKGGEDLGDAGDACIRLRRQGLDNRHQAICAASPGFRGTREAPSPAPSASPRLCISALKKSTLFSAFAVTR